MKKKERRDNDRNEKKILTKIMQMKMRIIKKLKKEEEREKRGANLYR